MPISGKRIKQARELRGLTQEELAKEAGLSQALIAQIERGLRNPSEEMADIISERSGLPASFFIDDPPFEFQVDSLLFRTHVSVKKRECMKAVRSAELQFEIAHLMFRRLKFRAVSIPRNIQEASSAARQTRILLGIADEEPIKNLIYEMEKAGVLLLSLPIDIPGCDAFSRWIKADNEIPFIAFCRKRPTDRLRFSLCHDLGHLVMGHGQNSGKEEEALAYTFAGEFLLPETAMRKEMLPPVTLTSLAQLKLRWKASIQALTRRALDLQIISQRQYKYIFEQLSRQGMRTRESRHLDPVQEKPRLFRQMAEMLYGTPINYEIFSADTTLHAQMLKEIIAGYAEKSSRTQSSHENRVLNFRTPKIAH